MTDTADTQVKNAKAGDGNGAGDSADALTGTDAAQERSAESEATGEEPARSDDSAEAVEHDAPQAAGEGVEGGASQATGEGVRWTRGQGRDPVGRAALALACLAAVCAAWSGWSWHDKAHDDSLHYAELRDEVLQNGEQAIVNLNTLDHRTLAQNLKSWQDSSTGDLYRDIVQGRARFERQVREARTITGAKILEGAVSELDEHAGKARIIVAVQITVTPPDGRPAVKRSRQIGELTRTSSGWKLSALGQAPVGGSGT